MAVEQLDAILRWPDVYNLVGLSRSTIWRLTNSGQFPAAIQIGRRAVGWRASEIHDWLQSCAPKKGVRAHAMNVHVLKNGLSCVSTRVDEPKGGG